MKIEIECKRFKLPGNPLQNPGSRTQAAEAWKDLKCLKPVDLPERASFIQILNGFIFFHYFPPQITNVLAMSKNPGIYI